MHSVHYDREGHLRCIPLTRYRRRTRASRSFGRDSRRTKADVLLPARRRLTTLGYRHYTVTTVQDSTFLPHVQSPGSLSAVFSEQRYSFNFCVFTVQRRDSHQGCGHAKDSPGSKTSSRWVRGEWAVCVGRPHPSPLPRTESAWTELGVAGP